MCFNTIIESLFIPDYLTSGKIILKGRYGYMVHLNNSQWEIFHVKTRLPIAILEKNPYDDFYPIGLATWKMKQDI